MESDKSKQKASTSAAATTLEVAAMLSALSQVFSRQAAASSIVSDLDGEGSEVDIWSEAKLNKSQIRSPKKTQMKLVKLSSSLTSITMVHGGNKLKWRSKLKIRRGLKEASPLSKKKN